MTPDAAAPATTVRAARDRYLAANGFNLDAYAAPFVAVSLFGLRFPFPNVGGLGRALPLHDLHHVALGYGTDLPGEAEICAWELRAGVENAPWIVRCIVVELFVLGMLMSPRRTLAAWRAARSSKTLFAAPLAYEALLDITVGELRAHLGVPPDGLGVLSPSKPALRPPLAPAPRPRMPSARS
jgi:hypothetical protein